MVGCVFVAESVGDERLVRVMEQEDISDALHRDRAMRSAGQIGVDI